jgi:hypothetical protein
MHLTDTMAAPVPQDRSRGSADFEDLHPLVQRMVREFEAPVGLLDPAGGAWCVRIGAEAESFPEGGAGLLSDLTRSGNPLNRVQVWKPGSDDRSGSGPVWLVLPAPREDGGPLLALIGFARTAEVAAGPANVWGPSCPDRALRAWGESFAEQLRIAAVPRGPVGADSTLRTDGNERLLIARLIRRLRISDPPERFQALATNALRSSLGVAAVAWVPGSLHDPVTFSGEVDGLTTGAYRALAPAPGHGPVQIVDRVGGGGERTPTQPTRRPTPPGDRSPSPPTARARPAG